MNGSLDPRHTVGRIFGTDWTIANVAKLLRFNAGQGVLRTGQLGVGMQEINQDYLRRTSARHLPSGVVVSFWRDEANNWHAELCFAGLDHYLQWSDAWAEEWLNALFLEERPRVQEDASPASETNPARRFSLVQA
jgi:hypothetical protein